jgi:hypothetical protein
VVALQPKPTQAKSIDTTIRAKRIAGFAGSSTNVTMNASLEPQAIKK